MKTVALNTKYDFSMEKLIPLIAQYCTFPRLEFVKLLRLVLFCFLIGNEDMHLKNFSLLCRQNKVVLSPAYDLLNSSLALRTEEELALPLRGKRKRLSRDDLIVYYGQQRLQLPSQIIEELLHHFSKQTPLWLEMISRSFLPPILKEKYALLLQQRWQRLS